MADYEKQFSTKAVNVGGRDGKSFLEDGSFEVNILPPGSKRDGANPEELFALGYSACFHASLQEAKRVVEELETINNKSLVCHTVSVLKDPETSDTKLQVEIQAGIEGLEPKETQKYVNKAHELCPYSKAIQNGHIDVSVQTVPYEDLNK